MDVIAIARWCVQRLPTDGGHRVGPDGLLRPNAVSTAWDPEAGQSTTEYALILLGVAVIALVLMKVGPDGIGKIWAAVTDNLSAEVKGKVKLP